LAYNKIEILCRILQWDASVEFKKRSMFNTVENPPTESSVIDLMPYCMELGEVSFNSIGDNIDEEINSLFYQAGDVNIKLTGIKRNKFLQNYFALFDMTGILQYRQYPIEIRYEGKTIFAGIVTQDSIKENFTTARDSETINLQIVGLEKEYREYYSNRELLDHGIVFSTMNGDTYDLGWNGDPRSEENGVNGRGLCRSKALRGVLQQNFNTENLLVGNGLADKWYVNNIPQFFYNPAYNVKPWFMRSGYLRFQQEGYSVYELFDCICNAMGWEWQIKRRPYIASNVFEYELLITDRKDNGNIGIEIDYQKVIEIELGYQLSKTDFEYLIIPDGNISSNGFYHTAGNCFKMATKKISPIINNSVFFFHVEGDPNGYQLYPLPEPQKYAIENAKAENKFDWAEIRYNGSPNWNDNRIIERKFIKSEKIVYLNAGSHSNMKTVVNTRGGRNYPATSTGQDDRDLLFSGNCGSMLFRYYLDDIGTQLLGVDYNDYSQGATFRDNFKSLLNNINSQRLEIKYKGLLTEPKGTLKIKNSHNTFFINSVFSITDLKVDLINEISTITLVRNN